MMSGKRINILGVIAILTGLVYCYVDFGIAAIMMLTVEIIGVLMITFVECVPGSKLSSQKDTKDACTLLYMIYYITIYLMTLCVINIAGVKETLLSVIGCLTVASIIGFLLYKRIFDIKVPRNQKDEEHQIQP